MPPPRGCFCIISALQQTAENFFFSFTGTPHMSFSQQIEETTESSRHQVSLYQHGEYYNQGDR